MVVHMVLLLLGRFWVPSPKGAFTVYFIVCITVSVYCRIKPTVKTDEAKAEIKQTYLEVASALHVSIIKYGPLTGIWSIKYNIN